MSAFGYKQTLCPYLANVRFTPKSGHKWLWYLTCPALPRIAAKLGREGGYQVLKLCLRPFQDRCPVAHQQTIEIECKQFA